jgi:iron(III) transport system permease protein
MVWAQQRCLVGKSFATVAGKAFRPRSLNLGPWRWFTFGPRLIYIFVVVVLPTLALWIAAFASSCSSRTSTRCSTSAPTAGAIQPGVRQPAHHAVDLEHAEGRRDHGRDRRRVGLRHRLHGEPHPGARPQGDRPAVDHPVAIPGLVIGVAYLWAWIGLPGGLYGTIWILGARIRRRFIPDTVKALSTSFMQIHKGARGGGLDLRPRLLSTIGTIVLPLARPVSSPR